MREIGKIGLRALALALALLGSGATYASHTVGGWISYEYTGATTGVANQYRVRLVLVREQGSLNYGTFQSVKISSVGCSFTTMNVNLYLAQPEYVDTSANLFKCVPNTSTPFQPLVSVFESLVIIPQGCADVRIQWSSCCFIQNISGLSNPLAQGLMLEAELNTSVPNTYSSSAQLEGNSAAFVCSGMQATMPLGGFDPEGDSVRYELVPGRQEMLNGVYILSEYTASTNFLQPLATAPGTQLGIDPRTGIVTFTPVGAQSNILAIRAIDYRWIPSKNRWVRMGSSLRTLVVAVSTQCAPAAGSSPITLQATQPGWTSVPQSVPAKLMPCGDTSLSFVTAQMLACGTVSASDFQLINSQGAQVPIKRADLICTGGSGNTVELVFHGALVGGAYVLRSGILDASISTFSCDVTSTIDTIGLVQVVNCPSPAVIRCPGVPNCPPSVSVTGPHTFYSSWTDTALVGVPAHTSHWTLTGGYLSTPSVGDTVQAFVTGTAATLVLETRYGLCSDFDTLVMASTVDLPEGRLPKLELRPNPATDEVAVSGIPPGAHVEVINVLGQRVLRAEPVQGGSTVLFVGGLARGTYWVVASSPSAQVQTPLVKL